MRSKLLAMKTLRSNLVTALLLSASVLSVSALSGSLLAAQATATAPATAAVKKAATKMAPTPPPTDADIADAKSKGMVWVNLNTKVYHKDSAATYGKTKHGKFMSEADAQAAGYKAAQEPKAKAAKATATATKS